MLYFKQRVIVNCNAGRTWLTRLWLPTSALYCWLIFGSLFSQSLKTVYLLPVKRLLVSSVLLSQLSLSPLCKLFIRKVAISLVRKSSNLSLDFSYVYKSFTVIFSSFFFFMHINLSLSPSPLSKMFILSSTCKIFRQNVQCVICV